MNKEILNHYLQFSVFTNPGCYKEMLQKLPEDIRKIGILVRKQIIHRVTLRKGNIGSNSDLRYGDMDKFPWWRLRCDDDILPTASAMISELMRLDKRGFVPNRPVENKIVVTCRCVSILTASILKSKGIPCRVRSGFAPYFFEGSWDHWINQYWDKKQKRWIIIDVDGCLEDLGFDPFDIPPNRFDWAANTWLGIRKNNLNENNFINAGGYRGLMPAMWEIFYDFHSLMNNEIIYFHNPNYSRISEFNKLKEKDFKEIDDLAELMLDPDKNFQDLKKIWNTKKKFRILSGGLIEDKDHVKYRC
ncbi:MAG: hypothetical protein COS07_05350 [Candidatus Aenigmarchaeota archaeon CG01_land_8_20_14_3_00_37_9]|nr:MAG: hypothetical protein COS07_05350 [Candidatus Aenigmarchaeota archaeon CG01_land_8_20_14_3_00_37_9]